MKAKTEKYIPIVDKWIEDNRESLIKDLITLVNIKSVAYPGQGGYAMGEGCAKVLDKTLEIAASFGLDTENDDYYCGSALLRGSGEGEIAFVGHLDVVEEGDGWTYEPYNAIYKEGHVIGRGAADCKGSCIAALYAAKCLKDMGIQPKHTIRVLFGCQEESGMQDMVHFRQCHKDPDLCLVVDCPFPIHHGEKGRYRVILSKDLSAGNILDFKDGGARSATPAYAEMVISGHSLDQVKKALEGKDVDNIWEKDGGVAISVKGVAGHPSFPEKDGSVNAIQKLAAIMADSGLLDEVSQPAIAFLADTFRDFRGTGLGIAYEDELCGPTIVCQIGVEMENGVLKTLVHSRYAIDEDEDWMFGTIKKTAEDHGFSMEIESKTDPWYVPLDAMNGLPMRLVDISNELLGIGKLEPAILPAGTHAHMLKNSLGYGPTFLPGVGYGKPKFGFAHGADESISIELLTRALRVYALTVIEIDDDI